MNWLIVKNDLKRNKVINLALFLFMMFSSGLAVLSMVMAVQTFTSISELYRNAQPPHFVQMHKGDINQKSIDEFMSEYEGVTFWQTSTMLDVYGENIIVAGKGEAYSLSGCRLDIGLVRQNQTRDLLLDSIHRKVVIHKGEIGMPVILKEMYGMKAGDHVTLTSNNVTMEFVIKEFILDSMMNSTMCSSTRILLSDEDFNLLQGRVGEEEYLIEAYFKDTKEASDFQTAYENADLPQNGQAITYTIIFILSAITDIVTVFVFLLASILLILISFICVRFTIMAALEEDTGEIGTMKAIGMAFTDIRSLYLHKYRALAIAAVSSGYILALLTGGIFTRHISSTFGKPGISSPAIIISLVAGCLVFLTIDHYCKRVLKKLKRLTVVDALVTGKGFNRSKGSIQDGLNRSRHLPVNWLLGIREIYYKFKNWIAVFVVMLIAMLMVLIPVNLMNTFESPQFITYMGSSLEDLMIEVENGETLETGYVNVKQVLDRDRSIKSYYEYRRVSVQTPDAENELVNLHIDCGRDSGNELKYLSGRAPDGDIELAVSWLNALKLGKAVGDRVVLHYENKKQEFIVSGIYQDVTSGGFTAKSEFGLPGLSAEKYTFSVDLEEAADVEEKADKWAKLLGAGISVDPMEQFIDQTLGGVVKQLRAIVLAIVIIAACLAVLVSVLFLKLRLAKDLPEIAVLKAVGFTEGDIRMQYLIKTGIVSAVGILAGVMLNGLVGGVVVNGALGIAGIGIKKVELVANIFVQYIACPLSMLALVLLVTWTVTGTIKRYNIISIINE